MPGEGRVELSGLMWTAHVGVAVIDARYDAADGLLEDLAGALCFG